MNGGLSVPNIRTELMTMSATAVSKWTITISHIDQIIGEILLHNTRASSTYITPLDAIPRQPSQLRDNMWTTGAALCASLHSRPYEPRERDNVRWCYERFKSTIVQTQWDGDVFQIDLSSKMSDRLPGIIAEGRKLRGTFCAEWLPYMTSTADGWLLDPNGSPYKLAHTSLSVGTAQLGDILRWERVRPGVLNFIPTCGISGFSRPSIRALERLCATLVSNFPQLLYRPQQTNVLRLYNGQRHYNHEWHLHTSEATLTHIDTTLVKATHTVHSATDCDVMATRDLNGQKVSFHAHPRFTRIVQLWGGNGRYNTTRSFYRQQVAATRTQIGKDTRDAAVSKAVHTAGSLWPGLQEKADLSCSNPECSQIVQSSVQHLFWECSKAKLVWNYFYALWAKIGITPGHDPAIWIFSLDLPDTPRHAWTTIKRHIIGHKFSNEHLQDHLYSVAHMLWRYMSASLIQAIWCAHLRRMDSDPIESTAEMAIMMTRLEAGMRNLTRLAEAQAGDSDGHTVAAVLKAYVDCFLSQTDAIPLTPSDTRGVYLLFFDGGSHGNPGPGGTGSIIVRVHKDSHTASLIWTASMAYSRKDTINNFAEYWGLIHGLREAQRSHFEPLYVIGDSALIISQQRMHRSPRQHRLARLYQTSRRLADCIDTRGWYHHYRAFNKMADSAANLAMDTRTSTQVHLPTQRAAFNNLTQDLDNDVMHWLMRSSEEPRNNFFRGTNQFTELRFCPFKRHENTDMWRDPSQPHSVPFRSAEKYMTARKRCLEVTGVAHKRSNYKSTHGPQMVWRPEKAQTHTTIHFVVELRKNEGSISKLAVSNGSPATKRSTIVSPAASYRTHVGKLRPALKQIEDADWPVVVQLDANVADPLRAECEPKSEGAKPELFVVSFAVAVYFTFAVVSTMHAQHPDRLQHVFFKILCEHAVLHACVDALHTKRAEL
ncbi:reverse transcriptase, partial [Globisporangium splendens]